MPRAVEILETLRNRGIMQTSEICLGTYPRNHEPPRRDSNVRSIVTIHGMNRDMILVMSHVRSRTRSGNPESPECG